MIMAKRRGAQRRRFLGLIALSLLAGSLGAETPTSDGAIEAETAAPDDLISLAPYSVTAHRIEDFGFRIESLQTLSGKRPNAASVWFYKFAPQITAVAPNTAAAKAGLQPGDRILKSEGRSTVGGALSTGKFGQWQKTQRKKTAEVAAGKTNVIWTLEVESPTTRAVRTVKLVVPTPPPRWGASVWQPPEGRTPAIVRETGPLANRSRTVLDNGIWTLLPWPFSSVAEREGAPSSNALVTGYEWHIGNPREGLHRMLATQSRGRTQIFFETVSPLTGRRVYLTSPSGRLEQAWRWGRKENIAMMKAKTTEAAIKVGELSAEEAQAGFAHELDLWTVKITPGAGRWPLEVQLGYDANAIFAVLAAKEGKLPAQKVNAQPMATEFLRLRAATKVERALFDEAYGKLGMESEQWAYTETSHSIDDHHVLVTRVDSSQPQREQVVLRSIDGKAPTADEIQSWRDEGGEVVKPLGDMPPLATLANFSDLRVFKDEVPAVVFEAPMRNENGDFPAEKFQALFRVNKARRAFENISVRLRDSFRVAGVVKVTDAGLEIRFATLDPALAPQPVWLRMGGGARVLFLKISRSFEATRTDFRRVEPYTAPDF